MMRDALLSFLLGLGLLAALPAQAQGRFRLADPQSLSGAGSGWAVDPATGALSLAVPVATVPGEIPIPAVFHVAASHSAQLRRLWSSEQVGSRNIWSLDGENNLHRPMLGTLHFGYIDNGGFINGVTDSATYVLEDGTQFREEDWGSFTNYHTTFTLPQDFGLSAVLPTQVKVSSNRAYATYLATGAALGATVNAKVQATLPVGHTAPTQFRVILDKDRARVMAFLSGLNAWAPLLWLDRFGHQVAFKWTVSTSGLPAGATALHSVVVSNQRPGQGPRGLQVQWAAWADGTLERDLLRADFVGIDAPSIFVRGYSGQPSLPPVGFAYNPAPDGDLTFTAKVAGVVGRPTSLKVGYPTLMPEPVWSGSSAALPKVPPVVTEPMGGPLPMEWRVYYDANKAAITEFTDAMGVRTHFEYGPLHPFPYGYSQGARAAYGNTWKHSVTVATSTDGQVDPVSNTTPEFKRTWDRSPVLNNSWTTTCQAWWPSMGPAQRKVELGFGSATQPVHYGNAAMALQRILSADGTIEYAKTVYTNQVSGLTETDSVRSGIEVSRMGEATFREGYGYSNGAHSLTNRLAGPFGGIIGGEFPLEQTVIALETLKDKLVAGRMLSQTITRADAAGAPLSPTRAIKNEFDATSRLPKKTYLDGGADGQMGSTMIFDAEGRLFTRTTFASFSTEGVTTELIGYGTDGYPNGVSTVFSRPSNQTGAHSISQTSTYDSAGRLRTQTDPRGVKTTFEYDTLGRPRSMAREGEELVTYEYPGLNTRRATQGGRTTTELTDGFGRLLRRTLPGGQKVEFTYDAHGRLVNQKEFCNTGTPAVPSWSASRASTTEYDLLDRPTLVSSPGGSSQSIAYSASADLKQSIVTTSLSGVVAGRKVYRDVLGQVLRTEEPTGAVTTLTYDGAGNLKTQTTSTWKQQVEVDETGNPRKIQVLTQQDRSFQYNALGFLTEKIEPETRKQTFSAYNALGKPGLVTEDAGSTTERIRSILYDGLGRVCKVSSSTGTETLEFIFDGPFLRQAIGGGTTSTLMDFGYKPASGGARLASESTTLGGVAHTLSYAYLPTGQLDTITYPEERRIVGYTYDTLGRVTGIQDRTGGGSIPIVSRVDFNPWGQRSRLNFASGAYSDWSTHDDLGIHLKDWTIGYTTGGLGDPPSPHVGAEVKRAHTYDLAKRLNSAGEWQTILHDGANRLAHAEAPGLGVSSVDLNHDGFGNNTSHQVAGTSASSFNNFSFDPLATNQLPSNTLTGGATGWVMNGYGEATQIGTGTSSGQYLGLGWDGLGRVKSLATIGLAQSYTYAPSGLRIRVLDTATPANNRRYAYTSGGLLMSEFADGAGSLWKRDVVYLGSEPVAEIDAAGIHELHNDHLGTPRIITKGTDGTIEGKQAYGPYGEYLSGQAAGYQPLTGYTGHLQSDPSGLIYMRGRYFSPAWHRFVNSDQGVDPNSWNQMAYVGGSPFMGLDPSGMKIVTVTVCISYNTEYSWHDSGVVFYTTYKTDCRDQLVSLREGDSGGSGGAGSSISKNPLCDKLKALGLTAWDLALMQITFASMNYGEATPSGAFETGFMRDANGATYFGSPSQRTKEIDGRSYNMGVAYPGLTRGQFALNGSYTPFSFHGHFVGFGPDQYSFKTEVASAAAAGGGDMAKVMSMPINSFIGTPNQLFYVNSQSTLNADGTSSGTRLGDSEWKTVSCF